MLQVVDAQTLSDLAWAQKHLVGSGSLECPVQVLLTTSAWAFFLDLLVMMMLGHAVDQMLGCALMMVALGARHHVSRVLLRSLDQVRIDLHLLSDGTALSLHMQMGVILASTSTPA